MAKLRTLKAGILGAARIAPKAFIQPAKARGDIEIIAVGCRDIGRGESFIRDNDIPASAMSYAEVCTHPDIDMIYCALPPSAHIDCVVMALAHGKAVLVEKPFSMNAHQSGLMVEAARASGRPIMEAFHYYFHPAFQFALAQVRAGCIGQIANFEGAFTVAIPNHNAELRYQRELGGGALMDLGCYVLHALRQLVGEPDVTGVDAVIESGVDVYMKAELDVGGVPASLICDMRGNTVRGDHFTISGTSGKLRFNSFVAPHHGHSIQIESSGDTQVHEISGPITYAAQLEAFVHHIHGNIALLPAQDAILQSRAIDKIYAKIDR